MKLRLLLNEYGETCTDDFDPSVDVYDYEEEAWREMCAQAALDDYMEGYEEEDARADGEYFDEWWCVYEAYDEYEHYGDIYFDE